MMFLDCMYVICCNFYKKREKDIFKISGLLLLTLVFMLNVQLISFILSDFNLITGSLYDYRYYIVGSSYVIFFTILYIRYFRATNYEEVNNKFYKLDNSRRNLYYTSSVLYVILSFVSTLGYAFYQGGIVSGWW